MQSKALSELAKLTGLKPRTLQFWTASGALVPEAGTKHGGPGVHRRYAGDEVVIARILAAISRFNLQIGQLVSIAQLFRNSINTAALIKERRCLTDDELIKFTEDEIQRYCDIWCEYEDDDKSECEYNSNAPITFDEMRLLNIYLDIFYALDGDDDCKVHLYTKDDEIFIDASSYGRSFVDDVASVYLTLNLGKILNGLH